MTRGQVPPPRSRAEADQVAPATAAVTNPVRHRVSSPRSSQPAPVVDEPDTTTKVDPDRPWEVIVWDDPVNLMSYVVWVFMRVFSFPEPVARKLMLEVHEEGRSLVASEPRERAEFHLQQLHGYGLHATIQRAG